MGGIDLIPSLELSVLIALFRASTVSISLEFNASEKGISAN